jgi:hypothetical protein
MIAVLPFDGLLLAASNASRANYAAPVSIAGGLAVVTSYQGYSRARRFGRNAWFWTIFCLAFGLPGFAFFWLLSRHDVRAEPKARPASKQLGFHSVSPTSLVGVIDRMCDDGRLLGGQLAEVQGTDRASNVEHRAEDWEKAVASFLRRELPDGMRALDALADSQARSSPSERISRVLTALAGIAAGLRTDLGHAPARAHSQPISRGSVFDAMNVHRPWLAGVAGLALIAAAVAAFFIWDSLKGSSTPEPDRVVGVSLKCTLPATTQTNRVTVPDGEGGVVFQNQEYVVPAQELSSDECRQWLDRAPAQGTTKSVSRATMVSRLNARQEVTVRTSAGNAYTIEVPVTTPVAVGDPWPPAR